MTPKRATDAGVTLIEMLVVLAMFAIVAGLVVFAWPGKRGGVSADLDARAMASHLERAVDIALSRGAGFGVTYEGGDVRFVDMGNSGKWEPHSDERLAKVKLSARPSRISVKARTVFAVSDQLAPTDRRPLRIEFGTARDSRVLVFDGVNVRITGQGDG